MGTVSDLLRGTPIPRMIEMYARNLNARALRWKKSRRLCASSFYAGKHPDKNPPRHAHCHYRKAAAGYPTSP